MAKQEVPKNIRASLYIDGKPAQNSIKNTEQVVRTLRKELNGLTIGTAEWNAKMSELKVHQATLSGIRKEVNNVGGAFGWLKTEVGKFGALAAGYLGFQFITTQFQNIIASNAKLSDSLADIRRVADLTEDEVRRLDKSFGDLDTRTSKSGLREIAIVAGRLGVAKDDILEFVQATDMLVVALGDELGNADQITTQLGKILNVFDGEVTGDNITRLGNAMVKLANDGVASAGFISDFTQRLSGIAKTANLSLGATVGLAAGLEEMGARTESSATAIQKLLVTMAQDLPAAAKIAGVSAKEFTELFGRAPEEALIRYAEGLTQNKGAFSEIAVAFKDAGEEGVRVVETITKLGERADFMRSKFVDGSEALQSYNEIQTAFEMKNETLGAKMDKLGKAFNKLAANKLLVGLFTELVEGATSLMEVFSGSASETERLVSAFNKQNTIVSGLEKNLVPLIDRYDELMKAGKLNNDEQIELNTIIGKVRTALPQAATEFDKYGNAIAISTTKAREFIEAQKAMLQYKNQEAIKSAKSDLEEYTQQFDKFQRILKSGYTESELQEFFFGDARMYKLNDKMKADYVQRLNEMGQMKKGAEELIKTLSGEDIEIKTPDVPDNPLVPGLTPTGGKDPKADKIKAEQERIREMLQKNMNDIYIDSLEGAEKELAQLDQKYDEMRKKANNNKTALLQLEDQYNAEFIQLLKRTTKVADEEAEKRAILEAELVEEKEKAIDTISRASMSDNERELQQMRDHYRELIELAEKHGLDVTSLKAKWAGDEEKLLADQTDRKRKEQEEKDIKEREDKYGWAVESAKLVSDSLFSIGENRRRAELDSELHQIDKEREAALSAKNLTEEQKKAINDRFDQKAKVAKQKAFKADQQAAISQAIINGLVGIGQLWIKPGFPAAIPLAAMLGAQTAANVAVIASQKAPEYAVGGFSDKDPAGYVSSSTLFNRSSSGRPFVAGEAGKEWIAPNWMVNSPKYANIIGMLESARQEKRFFAGGGSTEVSSSTAQGSSADWSEMKVLMIEMIRAQREANDKEVLFVNKNYQKFNKELTFSMKSQGKS